MKLRVTSFLGMLVLVVVTLLHAQVFSVPISDKVIRFDLVMPGGELAQVEAREGSLVKVQDESSDYIYAFAFYLEKKGQDKGAVRFLPFQIKGEDIEQLGGAPFKVKGRLPSLVSTPDGQFKVTVKSVGVGRFPNVRPLNPEQPMLAPDELKDLYADENSGLCCVSCDPITVCGASVRMSCGSCSSGGGAGGGGGFGEV